MENILGQTFFLVKHNLFLNKDAKNILFGTKRH